MRHCLLGSLVLFVVVGCTGSVVDDDDSETGTGGESGTESGGSGGTAAASGGTGGTASGTGGADGTGGRDISGAGGTRTNLGGMGGESGALGGQGGAVEDTSVPWELTAILVGDPNPSVGPDDKRIIVWSESTYGCGEPNGSSTCTLGRDHARLSVPIAADQLEVGSFTMANHAGYSATGANPDVNDCWGGGGTLDGDVEVKSVSADSLVVRLSNLQLVNAELEDLVEGQDIEVVICQ